MKGSIAVVIIWTVIIIVAINLSQPPRGSDCCITISIDCKEEVNTGGAKQPLAVK